jgi:hypothetical protein
MTIDRIPQEHGAMFTGTFRIRRPVCRLARNGSPYLSMTLEDSSGAINAYSWSERHLKVFKDLDRVALTGKVRSFNGSMIVSLCEANLTGTESERPLVLIPRSLCPLPELLNQFSSLVAAIDHDALRGFVEAVMSDDGIAFPFISIPASRRHHHCIAGGLLEHSLECVAMVSRFVEFPAAEKSLAMVGALFHDIGKIRTLKTVGRLTETGYVCDHDSLTLEVLATYLKMLDVTCPDAAIALRYLWTWRNSRKPKPKPLLTIAETIAAADRISCGLNVQEVAFSNQPDWKSFARFGDDSSFWRPRLESRA